MGLEVKGDVIRTQGEAQYSESFSFSVSGEQKNFIGTQQTGLDSHLHGLCGDSTAPSLHGNCLGGDKPRQDLADMGRKFDLLSRFFSMLSNFVGGGSQRGGQPGQAGQLSNPFNQMWDRLKQMFGGGAAGQSGNTLTDLIDRLKKMFGFGNGNPADPQNFRPGAGAINNITGKAANMANDPMIKSAMQQLQQQQAANPGQMAKMTVKGSDGKKYKLSLDADGTLNIKKKGSGFLGGLFKGIGDAFKGIMGFASKILPLAANFIPGGGIIAQGVGFITNLLGKK